jgi:3-deoxy-D-manno-octulosonic-acid transferase
LVVTASTATGRERAAALYGQIADIRYLPYDLPFSVRRFLNRVQPCVGVILETELWPTLLEACAARGIPLLVASARVSERSMQRYQKVGRWLAKLLGAPLVHIAAQTDADRDRFIRLGAAPDRTTVSGNLKFDQMPPPDRLDAAAAWRARWGAQRPVWVAGSTHEGEEAQVLAAHRQVLAQAPDALLVLAPRHPPRFDRVAALIEGEGCALARRSTGVDPVPEAASVLLLDTLGELVAVYGAAQIAFVGGSLVPIGGHNLLEPLSVQCPTLTGPSNCNDERTARLLLDAGAVQQVEDSASLARAVLARFKAPVTAQAALKAAEQVLSANRGAVDRVLAQLAPLLPTRPVSAPTPDGRAAS